MFWQCYIREYGSEPAKMGPQTFGSRVRNRGPYDKPYDPEERFSVRQNDPIINKAMPETQKIALSIQVDRLRQARRIRKVMVLDINQCRYWPLPVPRNESTNLGYRLFTETPFEPKCSRIATIISLLTSKKKNTTIDLRCIR